MSDPLRTDGPRVPDPVPTGDRDAKIEQLLLAGLDCYVAAHYEQAINIWTRALFLDRTHPRARAYIERARSAQAEQQRESEELLENGLAALHRGEDCEASRLLRAAVEGGAPPDVALGLLDRLNRLAGASGGHLPRPAPGGAFLGGVHAGGVLAGSFAGAGASSGTLADGAGVLKYASDRPGFLASSFRQALLAALLGAIVTTGVLALAAWEHPLWRSRPAWPETVAAAPAFVPTEIALPLPRHGEVILARAQALAAGGHLHDALRVLAAMRPTDPEKSIADRLRADLQRQLLALSPSAGAVATPTAAPSAGSPGAPAPAASAGDRLP